MNYWMNSIIPFGSFGPFGPFGGRSRRRANRRAMNAQTKRLMGLGGLGLGAGLMFMTTCSPTGYALESGARSRTLTPSRSRSMTDT
jgi:hypothetical protein